MACTRTVRPSLYETASQITGRDPVTTSNALEGHLDAFATEPCPAGFRPARRPEVPALFVVTIPRFQRRLALRDLGQRRLGEE